MKIHVVQAGESVWSIASDYGVDPDRLQWDRRWWSGFRGRCMLCVPARL